MNSPSIAAITLGCKLNYSETSAILDHLSAEGWRLSSVKTGADMVIVHTCAVTNQAEQKCRQKIRQIIKRNPRSAVVAIGCYAQLQPQVLSGIEGLRGVFGSNDKFRTDLYRKVLNTKTGAAFVAVSDIGCTQEIHSGYSLPAHCPTGRTRAFLKIQDGCDYGCSYCTIPLSRGRSRSLPPSMLVDRAHVLAASGYREIVLTGVNIGDYRSDGTGLAGLLERFETVAVERIRISSIEPDVLDDTLLDVVARSEKIAPHFHVPLQSGSDGILRAMRRRYTTADYRERILRAAETIADCALGIDVIAGYPGESTGDFQKMYAFLDDLPAAYLHVFACSLRPGTPLARQIAAGERRAIAGKELVRRSRLLIELGERKKAAFSARFIGSQCGILVEECAEENRSIRFNGYTSSYLHVTATAEKGALNAEALKGRVVQVFIERMGDDLNLQGRLLF
ncbi:MAG: MiaB/RimO family radical SAM methylthiotransferase [Chlorobi bacterium]|nr:MiaB/RimO family radical SAM methylthiotransferase [Chlorobiota bacterium]